MLPLLASNLRFLSFTAMLTLTLALGYSEARAQAIPRPAPTLKPMPADMAYYVDGKQIEKEDLPKLAPDDLVESVNVLQPTQQQRIFGTATARPATIITTKAKAQDPAVLAFNQRINDVVPLVPATPAQQAGIAAATAYVQQHYPGAKLESVGPEPGQADRYRATFLHNGQRVYLLLNGQGQVVK